MSMANIDLEQLFRAPAGTDVPEQRYRAADASNEAMRRLRNPFRVEPLDGPPQATDSAAR
ncbi:MAG TPA: hypothetical protein VF755_10235 [Catenuloplanes sp.]